MSSSDHCRICAQPTIGNDAAQLWDGRWYCRGCVERVSPELYRYAMAHDRLEESAPFDSADLWRSALRLEAIVFTIFALLLGTGGYYSMGISGVIYGLGLTMVMTLVQAGIQLPMFVRFTKSNLPTVYVSDGMVTVHRGVRKKRLQCTRPLHDFRCRHGRARQDSLLSSTIVPRRTVILLVIPAKGWLLFGPVRIACGWTDEAQRIWSAFLTLAGIATDSRTSPPKPS